MLLMAKESGVLAGSRLPTLPDSQEPVAFAGQRLNRWAVYWPRTVSVFSAVSRGDWLQRPLPKTV